MRNKKKPYTEEVKKKLKWRGVEFVIDGTILRAVAVPDSECFDKDFRIRMKLPIESAFVVDQNNIIIVTKDGDGVNYYCLFKIESDGGKLFKLYTQTREVAYVDQGKIASCREV